jgi:hypothetical protein
VRESYEHSLSLSRNFVRENHRAWEHCQIWRTFSELSGDAGRGAGPGDAPSGPDLMNRGQPALDQEEAIT